MPTPCRRAIRRCPSEHRASGWRRSHPTRSAVGSSTNPVTSTPAKASRPELPTSAPLVVVYPEVVRAGQSAGVTEAVIGDLGAAVATDVEEGSSDSVVAAHHDNRAPGDGHGGVVAGLGDVDREGDQ